MSVTSHQVISLGGLGVHSSAVTSVATPPFKSSPVARTHDTGDRFPMGMQSLVIPWRGILGTALWGFGVLACLAISLPNINTWWLGATPCSAVPECVDKVGKNDDINII